MARIYIDTEELHGLARTLRSDTGALGDINVDLTRAWARAAAPSPELAGIGVRSAAVQARIATLGAGLHAQAADLDREGRAREIDEGGGIAGIIGGYLGQGGWTLAAGALGWPVFGLGLLGRRQADEQDTVSGRPNTASFASGVPGYNPLTSLRAGDCFENETGTIVGPDGRSYELYRKAEPRTAPPRTKIPAFTSPERANFESGADNRWSLVGRTHSVGSTTEPLDLAGKAAVVVSGLKPGRGEPASAEEYARALTFSDGVPLLDVSSLDGPAPHRAGGEGGGGRPPTNATAAGVKAVQRVAEGAALIERIDKASVGTVQVSYFEHEDGRLRADVKFYQVWKTPDTEKRYEAVLTERSVYYDGTDSGDLLFQDLIVEPYFRPAAGPRGEPFSG